MKNKIILFKDKEKQLEFNEVKRIAIYLWEKYYKDTALNWEPLDTTLGILSQIDNMIAGLNK